MFHKLSDFLFKIGLKAVHNLTSCIRVYSILMRHLLFVEVTTPCIETDPQGDKVARPFLTLLAESSYPIQC